MPNNAWIDSGLIIAYRVNQVIEQVRQKEGSCCTALRLFWRRIAEGAESCRATRDKHQSPNPLSSTSPRAISSRPTSTSFASHA
jgi:hypothetical protein